MNDLEKVRELVRKFSEGRIRHDEFVAEMSKIQVTEIDLTPTDRDELGIRAQAAAERIRRR
jgi:hypothetical protein